MFGWPRSPVDLRSPRLTARNLSCAQQSFQSDPGTKEQTGRQAKRVLFSTPRQAIFPALDVSLPLDPPSRSRSPISWRSKAPTNFGMICEVAARRSQVLSEVWVEWVYHARPHASGSCSQCKAHGRPPSYPPSRPHVQRAEESTLYFGATYRKRFRLFAGSDQGGISGTCAWAQATSV